MKYVLVLLLAFGSIGIVLAEDGFPEDYMESREDILMDNIQKETLKSDSSLRISVKGMGVAPSFAISPAQSYVLAKRAAIVDSYRLIAERLKGVRVEGKDTLKNMMLKSSKVSVFVQAMIKNAEIVETTFKDGLCEVEMEIVLEHSQFE